MPENDTTKTIIAQDVDIMGSIKCSDNIQIDGKLSGDLTCSGNALIGETSTIKGNISVNSATINGQINGNINAKDKVELKPTAKVNGDIRAKRMTVEDGVTYVGKAEINSTGAKFQTVSDNKTGMREVNPSEEGGDDNETVSRKNEIRNNIKEELKEKSGGFFGKK